MTTALKNIDLTKIMETIIRKSEPLYNMINVFSKKEYQRKQVTFSRPSTESLSAI